MVGGLTTGDSRGYSSLAHEIIVGGLNAGVYTRGVFSLKDARFGAQRRKKRLLRSSASPMPTRHKARHKLTSPGATPSIRPPSADWQLPALSSTARPSPSEAPSLRLHGASDAAPAQQRGRHDEYPLARRYRASRTDGVTVLQLRAPWLRDLPGFFSEACANWLWPAPRLAPPVQCLRCLAAERHQLLRVQHERQ